MATSSSNMIPSSVSLVRYESPILVTTRGIDDGKAAKTKGSQFPCGREPRSSAKVPRFDLRNRDQTAEILDAILPPREYEEGGTLWIQPVSRTPATRLDVINLQERLDSLLTERQARELGICSVRRELYDQCFDELIRQETINCAERGLLLLRVRDELRITLAAYETLYESSIAFGIRKALLSEKGKMDIEDQVRNLLIENGELREQLKQMDYTCAQREQMMEQKMAMENRKHSEEVEFLKKTKEQLKAQLAAIIIPKKDEPMDESQN